MQNIEIFGNEYVFLFVYLLTEITFQRQNEGHPEFDDFCFLL